MQTPTPTISEPLLQQVSQCIEARTGLHFPPARFNDLERGLVQAAREAGCRDGRTYAESLVSRQLFAADIETLAGSLTIGETHFFRDPRAFEFLQTTLLPELIAAKRGGDRRLRLWSAGCATGEEPYSLAILLHRLLPDLADWQITILGTDLNPKVLARAAVGVYTEWSFRDTPAWVKTQYFLPRPGGRFELQPWLKPMVQFACVNLADDDFPSVLNHTNAMDLIVCRNVLLYFSTTRIPQVVERFHRALVGDGLLVLGAVEASQMTFPEFTPVPSRGVALYRKTSGARSGQPQTSADWAWRPAEVGVVNSPIALKAEYPEAFPVIPNPKSEIQNPKSEVSAPPPPTFQSPPAGTPQSLFTAGRYREARNFLLAESDRIGARDAQSALLLAQCHANLGELAEALVWCERALTTARTDATAHFLRATILQELQRDEEALLALRNVLFLDPGHVLAHFHSANLHRRHHRAPAAARHLANVRELLAQRAPGDELPQSGGLTAGRLHAMLPALEPVDDTAGRKS